uniref:TAF6_C domain-containing protein n=4 Tax=Rhodnius TaxID=13248 RepID=T1HWT4_RHOPR
MMQQIVRDINLTDNLIATVEAISKNKYVCVSTYIATNYAANALLKIVIEAPESNNDNDIILRIRAGTLLARVIGEWRIEIKQYMDTVKHLLEYLLDPNAPIQSHFGSVVTLTALGEFALITYVWPIIEKYLMLLAGRIFLSPFFDPYTLHIMTAV